MSAQVSSVFSAMILVSLLCGAAVGCSSPEPRCPAGALAVVAWSSETDSTSRLQFVDRQRVLETRSLAVQGINPSVPPVIRDGSAYFLVTGNTTKDRTSVVRIDTHTCATQVIPLEKGSGYTFTAGENYIVHSVSPTQATIVYRSDLQGKVTHQTELTHRLITALTATTDRVYAMASDDVQGNSELIEMDAETLQIRQRIPLEGIFSSPGNTGDTRRICLFSDPSDLRQKRGDG